MMYSMDYTDESFHFYNQAQDFYLPYYGWHEQIKNEALIQFYWARLWRQVKLKNGSLIHALASFVEAVDHKQALLIDSCFDPFIQADMFSEVSSFIQTGHQLDGQLSDEDLFQAFRNLCVIFSLQLDQKRPLELTPAIYAYVILYPYTDNFLDDPSHDQADKKAFNQAIQRALKEPVSSSERVEELIEQIAQSYPRQSHPTLFQALEMVLSSQADSLSQYHNRDMAQVCRLALKKGGAAVLADALIVSGQISSDQARYCFLYGGLLQFIDDLQDLKEDLGQGSSTYFSLKRDDLDGAVKKLFAMVEALAPAHSEYFLARTIRPVSHFLIYEAVNHYRDLLSEDCFDRLAAASPVRLSFYPKLREMTAQLLQNI